MTARPDQFDYIKKGTGEAMAKEPANKNESTGAQSSSAKKVNHFQQAGNQVGMALALLGTMVLNVPIFQRASDENQTGMLIFEVILMFLCTASCGILGMNGVHNLGRGITDELRRQLTAKTDSDV